MKTRKTSSQISWPLSFQFLWSNYKKKDFKFDIQLEKEMTWLWDRRMIASGQEKGRWNSIEFVVVSYKNENSACTVKFLFKKVRADCRTFSKILAKNTTYFFQNKFWRSGGRFSLFWLSRVHLIFEFWYYYYQMFKLVSKNICLFFTPLQPLLHCISYCTYKHINVSIE